MTLAAKTTKYVLLPLYKFFQGESFYSTLAQLRKAQWLSPAELRNRQWQKLQALLEHAYENVPYYRQVFQSVKLEPRDIKTPKDFRRLPYLTKDIIRKRKDDLTVRTQKLYGSSTSGSTGEPLWFYYSHSEQIMRRALLFLGMKWAGLDIGERYAKLWGAQMRKRSRYQEWLEQVKNRLSGYIFLTAYDLSEKTLPDYIKRLKAHNPKLLESYPSPLRILGKYLAIHPEDRLQLEAIVTSSETLYDHDREFIEKVFCCPVFNRYGSREFGNVAHECAQHQGLHIYTEHAYVECLQNNELALPGEKGELVITSLSNYGMPFIRYRIGDYGEMSDQLCDCGRGFPLLKSVDGRVFDVVVAPNGRFIPGTYWTIVFRTVPGIRQFQLVQETVDSLAIRLITDATFQQSSVAELEERIQERCGFDMHLQFEFVDEIPLTKAGKRRFIISKIPMTFGNQ
jgi:phenylacetate-CoA ligase